MRTVYLVILKRQRQLFRKFIVRGSAAAAAVKKRALMGKGKFCSFVQILGLVAWMIV